jgi:hypothetical protein
LHPLGIRHIDMPATAQRIWQAIRVKQVRIEAKALQVKLG